MGTECEPAQHALCAGHLHEKIGRMIKFLPPISNKVGSVPAATDTLPKDSGGHGIMLTPL